MGERRREMREGVRGREREGLRGEKGVRLGHEWARRRRKKLD